MVWLAQNQNLIDMKPNSSLYFLPLLGRNLLATWIRIYPTLPHLILTNQLGMILPLLDEKNKVTYLRMNTLPPHS